MKISDLKIGQTLKEGEKEVIVVLIYNDRFEVEYISGVCVSYREEDLNNGTLETFIG